MLVGEIGRDVSGNAQNSQENAAISDVHISSKTNTFMQSAQVRHD
jgi:hypothetical protein